jgi:hypothetical protein
MLLPSVSGCIKKGDRCVREHLCRPATVFPTPRNELRERYQRTACVPGKKAGHKGDVVEECFMQILRIFTDLGPKWETYSLHLNGYIHSTPRRHPLKGLVPRYGQTMRMESQPCCLSSCCQKITRNHLNKGSDA